MCHVYFDNLARTFVLIFKFRKESTKSYQIFPRKFSDTLSTQKMPLFSIIFFFHKKNTEE